ncbi:MAG: FtsX-like permease family protein [Bdellovibrionaceae bacterium]|jgi:lipoprotein-releasing system permease protein|nr:FtsX-like permease family protein [Pseudobdellovibrionaceae bacterium]
MNFARFWFAWHFFKTNYFLLNLTNIIAVVGLAIGVASLVVSMAVVSGFETTLKQNLVETMGHVLVVKRGLKLDDLPELRERFQKNIADFESLTPFATLQGVLAHKGELSGVIIEGLDPNTVDEVLNFRHRIVSGKYDLSSDGHVAAALIGLGIADRFQLKVGDKFKVVIPKSNGMDLQSLSPKLKEFVVKGVMQLGRHEYNQRYIMTELSEAQSFAETSENIYGFRVKLKRDIEAFPAAQEIMQQLDFMGSARAWEENHSNVFKAVKQERIIIFFVIFIIIIAACFNLASALYVNSVKRIKDICIMKSIGATNSFVRSVFSLQGMFLGFMGTLLGVILGFALCYIFYWVQKHFGLIPSSVYHVDSIQIDIRGVDLFFIFVATMGLSYLASFYSASRGAKVMPAEGLKYE